MRLNSLFLAALLGSCTIPATAQYVRFVRPTDTIEVHGNTGLNTAATFEARVLLTTNTQGYVLQESGNKSLLVGATRLFGVASGTGGSAAWNFPVVILPRRWHHIAYVYDGAQDRLYLDGNLVGSRSRNGVISNGQAHFSIGSHGSNYPSFIGYLDAVRVSNVVRYTGQSFTPPTGDFLLDANTQLLYNFNEPLGSTAVTDPSDLENHGTFGTGFLGATSPELVATVPESGSVSGTVHLIGCTDPQQNLTFELRPASGDASIIQRQVLFPVGADTGSFYLTGIPVGTYNIAIKGHSWLQEVIPNVTISSSPVTVTAELAAGDLNNDNRVDILDLLSLIGFYNRLGAP